MTTSDSFSVLLFASYADTFGTRRLELPLASPARVRDVVEAMRALPGGARLPDVPLVAVNRVWTTLDAELRPTDEIAVIPPVAGG